MLMKYLKNLLTVALAVVLCGSVSAYAQRKVSGTVLDPDGEPVIGAAVLVAGTTTGTSTDIDGRWSLNVPNPDATLEFSSIGFVTKTVGVAGRSVVDVTLEIDAHLLEETVVIGYSVQRKSDVTGAIASISSDDLANRSAENVANALQGKAAGVQIARTSGAPGSVGEIRVRGVSSSGDSSPLYIVDGLKVSDISYLAPENIASIEILKDAASAAIYGAEAGNGVVLVTTKTAKEGEGQVFFNASYSVQSLARKADVLNAEEYVNFMTEAGIKSAEEFQNYYYNDPSCLVDGKLADTDWQDLTYRTGHVQNYTVGFQGGSERGSVYIALSYFDQNGIVYGDKDTYNRLSSQVNASYKIKDWLTVGATNSIEIGEAKTLSQNNAMTGLLAGIVQMDPLTPLEYSGGLAGTPERVQSAVAEGYSPFFNEKTGNYYGTSYWQTSANNNPIAEIERDDDAYVERKNVNGTFYADVNILKGLVFTSRLGYRIGTTYSSSYTAPYWKSPLQKSESPSLGIDSYDNLYYQWENFANYNKSFGKHDFSLMAGMSYIRSKTNYVGGDTNELENLAENYRYLDYSTEAASDHVKGTVTKTAQLSYFGRFGWSYGGRYNLMVNFRADAYDSSKLHPDHRWGYFPSVSAGWTPSNEAFLSGLFSGKGWSYLKLRASWGVNGSISNLSGYQYASTVVTGSYYPLVGTDLVIGTYPSSYLVNPTLRWEKSKQLDFGLDARFLRDRLTMTVDYYNKNTDGMLIESQAALTTGSTSVFRNVGVVHNDGIEVELGWKDKVGDFGYGISANAATVNNKIKEYLGKGTRLSSSTSTTTSTTVFEEGYSVWDIYGYKYLGVNPEDGTPIFEDLNGDGEITEADKDHIGSAIPKLTYGFTLNLEWKNFDFIAYGAGSAGTKLKMNLYREDLPQVNRFSFEYDDRWTASNTNASRPKPTTDSKYYGSSAMVFDASFFKIKQLQLGYSLPQRILAKSPISYLRLYVSLDDFFTFTDYPGMDPETRSGTTSGMGVDMGSYPISKSVLFGVNLRF